MKTFAKIKNIVLAIILVIFIHETDCHAQKEATLESEAKVWCDNFATNPVEGIWEYPEDNTRVLIKPDTKVPGAFTLTVIGSPDCRLTPGDVIGRLYPSIDTRQFRLQQYTHKDNIEFLKSHECQAILSKDNESIRVKSQKLKFKINPTMLLPRFWRVVRFSIDNPVDDLPAGLIKIYPGYDHNGSLRRKIRIL